VQLLRFFSYLILPLLAIQASPRHLREQVPQGAASAEAAGSTGAKGDD